MASVQQLSKLSAEVLRFHLAAQDLLSSGFKSLMASDLYDSFHAPTSGAPSPPSSTMLSVQQSTSLNISSAPSQQPISTGASTTPKLHTHSIYVSTSSPIASSLASRWEQAPLSTITATQLTTQLSSLV